MFSLVSENSNLREACGPKASLRLGVFFVFACLFVWGLLVDWFVFAVFAVVKQAQNFITA